MPPYGSGASRGPEAILRASRQIDFHHRNISEAWKLGVSLADIPINIKIESERVRALAAQLRNAGEKESTAFFVSKINEACETLNVYVRSTVQKLLRENKLVGIVGGDHSAPLGFLRALSEQHERFGVLQIDAHPDLRRAYEGLLYSHGSIMHNALKLPSISRLVQVGVRDVSPEDDEMMRRGYGRVKAFHFEDLLARRDAGSSWTDTCQEIVKELPEKVYVSFDIDGLDPKLCPNTGTPVPGGLDFHDAMAMIKAIAISGRTIIGFDLCEVAPGDNEWDANVGARVLWELCCWMGVSNKLLAVGR